MSQSKIIIFTEGQTELIFLRNLLLKCFNLDKISFECVDLFGESVPYDFPNPDATTHFQIVNIGNDEKVLAEIKRREKDLFEKGFEAIFALRDMFTEKYDTQSQGKIDLNITEKILEVTHEQIQKMSKPEKIRFHFAIMEIEAWFLAIYENFERIDSKLDLSFLNQILHCDLSKIDPETTFFKPSREMYAIFKAIGQKHNKDSGTSEKLVAYLEKSDFDLIFERNVCKSFQDFYSDILNFNPNATNCKQRTTYQISPR